MPSERTPFIYGRPVRGLDFINRVNEIQTVFNRIRNAESTAITGPAHIGKSSFLMRLMDVDIQEQFLESNEINRFTFSLVDLLSLSGSDFSPEVFWDEALTPLHGQISEKFDILLSQVKNNHYSNKDIRFLFRTLTDTEHCLVLLLDEFEVLLKNPKFQDLSFYAMLRSFSYQSGGLVLVLASRLTVSQMNDISAKLGNVGSPFFNHTTQEFLKPFDESNILDLLTTKSSVFSREELEFVRRVAGPTPYLLQAMASALYESRSEKNKYEIASEMFYNRIIHHFDDIWADLDDATRTMLVILCIKNLDARSLNSGFSYGEIEKTDSFGLHLRRLYFLGLAEQLNAETSKNRDDFVSWRGEKWAITSDAFAWWIRDTIISKSHESPSINEWLTNHRYMGLLSQRDWNEISKIATKMPSWALQGVFGLTRSLLDEIKKNV